MMAGDTVKTQFSLNMLYELNQDEVLILAGVYNESRKFVGSTTDISLLKDETLAMEIKLPAGEDCDKVCLYFLSVESGYPVL